MDENNLFKVTDISPDTAKSGKGAGDADLIKTAKLMDSDSFHCSSCGSIVRFDPIKGKQVCEHCGGCYDMPKARPVRPQAYSPFSETEYTPWGGVKSVRCGGCGAVSVLDTYQTAHICPFCGATEVVDLDEVPGIKPGGILPFKIGQEQAHHAFIKWLKGRIFAPRKVKKNAKRNPMTGMYLPTWTFGANMSATYKGRLGKTYTVTVGSGKNKRTQVRVRWFHVSGEYSRLFGDVHIEASSYITQKDMDNLGGYDVCNAVEYEDGYMAGFVSERYSEGLDYSWEEAKDIMRDIARTEILARYHYDRIDYLDVFPDFDGISYKYILVPLWTSSYKYKDKTYGFAVNGRNGKVKGKSPISGIRVTMMGLFIAALVGSVLYLILRALSG